MTKGKILVIGATGYVGRYLCTYLNDQNCDVLALGRSKAAQAFFEANHVPFQYFDLKSEQSYAALPRENIAAIVILSACLAEHETPVEEFFAVNTLGVYRVLEFARENGIQKVVMTSSHKVYNDINKPVISEEDGISFKGDHSPYIISKIAAENFMTYYHKDFGLQTISLRLTGVHGYGEILGHLNKDGSYKKSTFEIFFEKALRGEPIEVWGDQSVVRDHVYIKDVVSAIQSAVDAPTASGIYNIACGRGYSQYDEAVALAKIFAVDKVSPVSTDPAKPGLTRGYVYDISKAERELGWKPAYTTMEAIYSDYKKEWVSKKYHNYHHINPQDRPETL
ncbi:MAG: NAD(P)-dependent oxidoreductase [Eubacteriales bacterium]|nr:NAD(P)-dependent oxidoreductase [Eubacteriales bacterium]